MRSFILLPLLLVGCGEPEPTTTAGIASRDLTLQVLTETDDTSTRVVVGIYTPGHTYARLMLAPGERLVARVEGAAPVVLEPDASSYRSYAANVGAVTGTIAIDLERPGDAARDTVVSLPPPFTIGPSSGLMKLGDPFTLTWSPAIAEQSVRATVTSSCVGAAERTLASDTGSFTWSAADFATTAEAPCIARFHLHRGGGAIDKSPSLAGIQLFRAQQVRSITIWATP